MREIGTKKGNDALPKDCQYDEEDWDVNIDIDNSILMENPWSEMGKFKKQLSWKGNRSWPVNTRVQYEMAWSNVLNWFESCTILTHINNSWTLLTTLSVSVTIDLHQTFPKVLKLSGLLRNPLSEGDP